MLAVISHSALGVIPTHRKIDAPIQPSQASYIRLLQIFFENLPVSDTSQPSTRCNCPLSDKDARCK